MIDANYDHTKSILNEQAFRRHTSTHVNKQNCQNPEMTKCGYFHLRSQLIVTMMLVSNEIKLYHALPTLSY